ncbi:NmrA family NAD(P)-binding protein [Phenylobacterium sp.]|jgi:uncharacterized protein YbjT (DUF2867 family)|uniref:NmrA family NAD(P)-binding protein n=1 Tax=Phenylobacterium sp. TaxID=1871053 RepID=UPI002F954949
MSRKRVVVTSASGVQSRAVITALAAAGHDVAGLTRGGEKAALVQAAGAAAVVADPLRPDKLAAALEGAQVVVFTPPVDYRPGVREALAEALALAARSAGVGRLILNSGAYAFEIYDRPVSATLRAVREILGSSGVPLTVLHSTVYMENLLGPWAQEGLAHGRLAYPLPADVKVSWISHRTLGAAVAAAADRQDGEGETYLLGGRQALTLCEVADVLARHLGRQVVAEAMSPDAFAAVLHGHLNPPAAQGVADYYRAVARFPDALAHSDLARLGVQAEALEDWASRQPWSLAR